MTSIIITIEANQRCHYYNPILKKLTVRTKLIPRVIIESCILSDPNFICMTDINEIDKKYDNPQELRHKTKQR